MTDAGSIGPQERKMYEQEYRHSADLFQRALTQYSKSDNPYQQADFKSVMDKAMQILNETANELMRQELQKQNKQIAKDYLAFQNDPSSKSAVSKLSHDLDQAKKSAAAD